MAKKEDHYFSSQFLQGIVVMWSDVSNSPEINNPTNKQIYASTVVKIDELKVIKSLFSLQYDDRNFRGLLSTYEISHSPNIHPLRTAIQILSGKKWIYFLDTNGHNHTRRSTVHSLTENQ